MKKGRIFIISGPSGSGKTTLFKRALADPSLRGKLVRSISVTTRSPREGERNGLDYIFISKKMFDYKKRMGHFLEWEKVFDNYYGTPNKNVKDLLNKGKNVLLCIDVKGAHTVCRKYKDAIRIFIKTATMEILKKRLKGRGSELEDVAKLRLSVAREELKESKHYDFIIVNDNLTHATSVLKSKILKVLNA